MEMVLLIFMVSLFASTLSGIAGSGGGFIVTPFLLLLGLPVPNAIAISKMGGIGVTFGSLMAFRGKGLVRKQLLVPLIIITCLAAFNAGWVIPHIDPVLFERIIGVALLLLTPTLFIRKPAFQPGQRSAGARRLGYLLFTIVTGVQTIIGTGLATFINLILMFCFGLTALEASATKRFTQSIQAVIVFLLLLVQGYVIFSYGIAILVGAFIGGNLGSKFALKKGDKFVKFILAVVMVTSGVALLYSAEM